MTLSQTSNGTWETFGMVGRDAKLRQIIETIRRVAPSDASVLIEGESGTGKQLIAVAIHAQSHHCSGQLCLKSLNLFLDRVISTGSGSDLVDDQHAIFPSDS